MVIDKKNNGGIFNSPRTILFPHTHIHTNNSTSYNILVLLIAYTIPTWLSNLHMRIGKQLEAAVASDIEFLLKFSTARQDTRVGGHMF